MVKRDSVAYVYARYSPQEIDQCLKFFHEQAEDFLIRKHWTNKAHVNDVVLRIMTFDVLQNINVIGEDKNILSDERSITFASYAASWWIKHKPLQCTEDLAWINEEFVLAILLRALPVNLYSSQNSDFNKAKKFVNGLFDQLKYGASDPQTLELILNCIYFVESLRED